MDTTDQSVLDAIRVVHSSELHAATVNLMRERDSARDIAVRLEQELAEAERLLRLGPRNGWWDSIFCREVNAFLNRTEEATP